MNSTEEKAMDVINAIFGNEDLPLDRIKSIDLHWEEIQGEYFPVLKCQFSEEPSLFKEVFKT